MLLLNNNFLVMASNNLNLNVFGPKSLSAVLFYFFRALSLLILITLVYIDFAFLMDNFDLENGKYYIHIPFTGDSIHGDYQFNVILTVSLLLSFGVIFFYVLSNIFKAFRETIIFSKKAINNLKFFTVLNLIIGPLLYLLIHFPIMKKTNYTDVHNLILHLIFGLIAFFLTQVFKKAYHIQLENNMTI